MTDAETPFGHVDVEDFEEPVFVKTEYGYLIYDKKRMCIWDCPDIPPSEGEPLIEFTLEETIEKSSGLICDFPVKQK
jgi:hypothetical protein